MFRRLARAGILSHIIAILVMSVVYFVTPQVELATVTDPEPTAPLGQWIYSLVTDFPSIARPLMIVLVILLTLAVNAILIRHDITPRQSFFPAFIALILMLFTPDAYHLIVTLACLILLLFSLHNVMNLYGEQYPFNKVLNATMAISVASMISPPVIIFGLFVWLGFFTFRINSWREWVISMMGLVLPYFYLALMYLWNNNLLFAARLYKNLLAGFSFTLEKPGPLEFVSIGLFVIWTLISASRFFADTNDKVISIRKKMWVIGHFAFTGLIATLLSGGTFVAMLPVIFLPVSAMIAYAVANSRRTWVHDILLILTFAAALFNRLNL
ncbi:MAG: hypothetical protein FD166_1098 [Bacteroidetes bacterium]|nr:MAG: hypothetical protein FD166_1098 [Bacteroidota bacterium]